MWETSKEERRLRRQLPYLKEHPEEVTPEFMRAFAPYCPYLNNLPSYIGKIIEGGGDFMENLREPVLRAIQELELNSEELLQAWLAFSTAHVKYTDDWNTARKKDSLRLKKEYTRTFELARVLEILVLPIYKKLRAYGFSMNELCA